MINGVGFEDGGGGWFCIFFGGCFWLLFIIWLLVFRVINSKIIMGVG